MIDVSQVWTFLNSGSFLAGLACNFVSDVGYDLGKSGLNSLGDRIAALWRAGGEFKNHDLLRALRFAECQAMVAVCSTCLLEDYGAYPSLFHAFIEGPDPWSNLTDPEVRRIAAIRGAYLRQANQVFSSSQAELEAELVGQLADVEDLVASTREIVQSQDADELRQRLTQAARERLLANATTDRLGAVWSKISGLFSEKDPTTPPVPTKLLERVDAHWFDMARLAFREVLKDEKFKKARSAFDLDILSKLSDRADAPAPDLATLEAKLDARDQKLDEVARALKEIHALLNDEPQKRKGNLNALFARQQQQFSRALAAYQQEVINRLDAVAASQQRVETKQDVVITEVTAMRRQVADLPNTLAGQLEQARKPSAATRAKPRLLAACVLLVIGLYAGYWALLSASEEPLVLRLQVVDADGKPIAGASVEVDALPGQVFTTTSDGSLAIEGIPRKIGDQIRVKAVKGQQTGDGYLAFPNPDKIVLR